MADLAAHLRKRNKNDETKIDIHDTSFCFAGGAHSNAAFEHERDS